MSLNGLDLRLMFVTHHFVELLPFKLVLHLNYSISGAAVSFLGWHQPIVVPMVFVSLGALGATEGLLIIPGFHGFYRLSYLVSQGLFEKDSGKILLRIECSISVGGGCTRVCCTSDNFMSALTLKSTQRNLVLF